MSLSKERTADLFRRLAGEPAFREWLDEKLVKEVEVLTFNVEPAALHRAQGRAQLIKTIKDLLV